MFPVHRAAAGSMVVACVFGCFAQQAPVHDSLQTRAPTNLREEIIDDSSQVTDTIKDTTAVRTARDTAQPPVQAAPSPPPPPAVEPVETPPASSQSFLLQDWGKIISIGPWLSYFYYNEDIDISPLVQEFRDEYSLSPRIIGSPKSTEYGALLGVRLQISHYLRHPNLFIRPGFALLLGPNNTYDGSSQGQPYDSGSSVVGIQFTPYTQQKTNIFLFGSFDMGYRFGQSRWSCVAYSGLDAKLWIRDMSQSGTTPYGESYTVDMSETYCWLSVPLGAILTRSVSSGLLIGMEPRIDLMFFGQMKALQSVENSDVTYDFPPVTLGNRASYRLEAFLQMRRNDRASFRFALFGTVYGFGKSNSDSETTSESGSVLSKGAFLEPSSASYQIGIAFSVELLRNSYAQRFARNPAQGE
jgi:hypothetical protein